jgi:hypothetical protein
MHWSRRLTRIAPLLGSQAGNAHALARLGALAAGLLAVAAAQPGLAASQASPYSTDLTGVCPNPVVFQTNWWPEPDHGLAYQLIGPNGTMDTNKNTYSGPLGSTGVNLEIRAGGPAIGFQTTTAQMYQDDSILLAFGGTDEQINTSANQPTVAVLAWYEKSPLIFFWGNPDWNFQSAADVGQSGATVLAFESAAYIDVLEGKGLISKDQFDTSYRGDPSRFVAADGNIVSQGFVTSEPYHYEHEVNGWMKPVKYLLLDKEFPNYQNPLTTRADKLDQNRPCLQKLIPLFQQAAVDYVKNPEPINAVITDFSSKLKGGAQTSLPGAAAAVQLMLDQGIVANGTDGVFGSFDNARVQQLIDDLGPVFRAKGVTLKDGLTPSDIVTNEFLDPSIKL